MFRKLPDAPPDTVSLTIDGLPVSAAAGETVAAVLLRQQQAFARTTPVTGAARAPYCMMGVCFDCLVTIDGAPSERACMILVREGLRVDRQRGAA